jgi:DNA/RNA-binding domain of Phe-tRNA-synthetase-like protein
MAAAHAFATRYNSIDSWFVRNDDMLDVACRIELWRQSTRHMLCEAYCFETR